MNDKRYLFRGFHPDEKGKTVIVLNGEKIRGTWKWGDLVTRGRVGYCIHPQGNLFQVGSADLSKLLIMHPVIPETVGRWITTDKNGKDVFEGDKVLCNGGTSYSDSFLAIVCYNQQRTGFAIVESDGDYFDDLLGYKIELIGNKWEYKND